MTRGSWRAWLSGWLGGRPSRAGVQRRASAPEVAQPAEEPFDPDTPLGDEPVELPIDGELDLHSFRPAEVASLVEAYVRECQARGVLELRIVHGKGRGTLRRTVHAVLDRLPELVAEYRLAEPHRGGWGATQVRLHPP